MNVNADAFISNYLRTCQNVFSDRQFFRTLLNLGIKVSSEECREYLDTSSWVFRLKGGLYITRAGAFTGRYFSFKPTRREVEQRGFAAGGRCLPFTDPDMLPQELTFMYKGEELARTSAEFDNITAADMFATVGQEFASQYIAADSANAGLDLAEYDFELPPEVKLTVNSLEPLIRYCGFTYGDRILCKVVNWDRGQIEILPVKHDDGSCVIREDDVRRQKWYDSLEKALLSSFDTAGPCSSIEEQLAIAFLDHINELCTPECGSVEEFLMQSRKVAYQPFGVETRLWRTGEDVPAVGAWNNAEQAVPGGADCPDIKTVSRFLIPDYIIQAYIHDQLFTRTPYDPQKIAELYELSGTPLGARDRKAVMLHIGSLHDIIEKSYNWFADYSIGPVRQRALALYREADQLVVEIDRSSANLEEFPQQALVILSQVFNHVMKIIELLELSPSSAADDLDRIAQSLDGMEFNLSEISCDLTDAVEAQKRNGFVVIKKGGA